MLFVEYSHLSESFYLRVTRENEAEGKMGSPIETSIGTLDSCYFQEEAHFVFSDSCWLQTNANVSDETFVRYVDYATRLNNGDLLNHVRKILFFQKNNQVHLLQSALEDLFIVLGSSGKALKKTLLHSSEILLSPEIYRRFIELVDTAPDNTTIENKSKEVSLPDSYTDQSQPSSTVKTEAIIDSYIENGQLEEAMDHLEKYLISNNNETQLGEILVKLYLSGGEHERWINFVSYFKKNKQPIPAFLDTEQ